MLLFCKLLKLFFRVDFKILLLLLVYLLLVSYLTQHHLLAPTSTSRSYQSRSSHSAVFLRKGVLKVCSKFTGEHPCQSVISATLLKSHFGMGVLLQICCIYSDHLFLRTSLGDCFWISHLGKGHNKD